MNAVTPIRELTPAQQALIDELKQKIQEVVADHLFTASSVHAAVLMPDPPELVSITVTVPAGGDVEEVAAIVRRCGYEYDYEARS